MEKVSDTMPLLSHIAVNYDIETINTIVECFFSIEMLNYDNPRNEKKTLLPKSDSKRKQFFKMLEEMDIAIRDVRLEKDLDAKLHPKLLQYIIELFTSPQSNQKGAQILLTSHDITTMNHNIFRRDEIWFCAKNPFGASKLYSLASFRKEDGTMIRNDEAYGKRYLEGRYGADPCRYRTGQAPI